MWVGGEAKAISFPSISNNMAKSKCCGNAPCQQDKGRLPERQLHSHCYNCSGKEKMNMGSCRTTSKGKSSHKN